MEFISIHTYVWSRDSHRHKKSRPVVFSGNRPIASRVGLGLCVRRDMGLSPTGTERSLYRP
jgi:hypothetical protein